MKKEKPDWIFQCRKCGHLVYILKDSIKKMLKIDCPDCGEEACENWILYGEGDYLTTIKS